LLYRQGKLKSGAELGWGTPAIVETVQTAKCKAQGVWDAPQEILEKIHLVAVFTEA